MVAIWWTWLGTYSPQLQVLAALAGVAVAAFGVWYARRYVRLTRDLARAARVQAEEARTAAQAALRQADAALRQADTTQHIFESGNRPYLEPFVDEGEFYYYGPDQYSVSFSLKNHGHVPAVLIGWNMEVWLDGQLSFALPMSGVGQAVFPGEAGGFGSRSHSPNPHGEIEVPIRLDIVVEYKAVAHEATYITRLTATKRRPGEIWGYRLEAS